MYCLHVQKTPSIPLCPARPSSRRGRPTSPAPRLICLAQPQIRSPVSRCPWGWAARMGQPPVSPPAGLTSEWLKTDTSQSGQLFKTCGLPTPRLPLPASPVWVVEERINHLCRDCRGKDCKRASRPKKRELQVKRNASVPGGGILGVKVHKSLKSPRPDTPS